MKLYCFQIRKKWIKLGFVSPPKEDWFSQEDRKLLGRPEIPQTLSPGSSPHHWWCLQEAWRRVGRIWAQRDSSGQITHHWWGGNAAWAPLTALKHPRGSKCCCPHVAGGLPGGGSSLAETHIIPTAGLLTLSTAESQGSGGWPHGRHVSILPALMIVLWDDVFITTLQRRKPRN